VLTIWHKDDVENLTKRLSTFREQLALRVLVLLNANQNLQSQKLNDLSKDTKEIIEVLSINHCAASSRIENHHRQIGQWHKDSETLAAVRHEEVIAAILTSKDGSKRTLQSAEPSSSFPQSMGPKMETSTTYHQGSRSGPHREFNPPGFTVADFSDVPRKILDCLYFRAIKDRYEVVAAAHQRTFEWLFEETESTSRPWSNFVQWLAHGHGCYWINGKAGSGKSTLTKFLATHDKTMKALRSWASGQELFTASFYFWNAGSTLQKSQAGLLRSLLFQIVEQKQRLIPVLFPGLCRAALAHPHEPLDEPTIAELKKAFMILMTDQIQNAKVCLFIDGIDEYAGDYHEVLDLFKQAVSSEQVKIVLSSRPIPSCVATFRYCPQLRLQDLTYDDIRLYVRDKLYGHELMKRLQEAENDAADKLVRSITAKASGVFLWVILVVRSMLDGLENFDRIADLQQRLDDLPPTLGNLYQHMFDAMSSRYRRQGARLFQLVLRSTDVQEHQSLSVLQLSFADSDDPRRALCAPTAALTSKEERRRCEDMEGRMRSRCCGLIEAQELQRGSQSTSSLSSQTAVGFMHRTVMEFLRTDEVSNDIEACTAEYIEPNLALLGSCLYELKAKLQVDCDRALTDMRHALAYCERLQTRNRRPYREYIEEVNRVCNAHLHKDWPISELRTKSCSSLNLALPDPFWLLSAYYGLTLFLQDVVREKPNDKELLMIHCVKNFLKTSTSTTPPEHMGHLFNSAKAILYRDADPNAVVHLSPSSMSVGYHDHSLEIGDLHNGNIWEKIHGTPQLDSEAWFFPAEPFVGGLQTVWLSVLDEIFYLSGIAGGWQLENMPRDSVKLILSLVEGLIVHGADVNATFVAQYRWERKFSGPRVPHLCLSAFAVLELFLPRVESGYCETIRTLMRGRGASVCGWRRLESTPSNHGDDYIGRIDKRAAKAPPRLRSWVQKHRRKRSGYLTHSSASSDSSTGAVAGLSID
jgi:hypothetical protein